MGGTSAASDAASGFGDEHSGAPGLSPHAQSEPPTPVAPSRSGVLGLAAAAVVAVVAVVTTVVLVSGPRSDATLQQVTEEPDVNVLAMMAGEEPWAGIDVSTLRGYEPYQQFEVWSAENLFGSRCLIAIHRDTAEVLRISCVPESAELFVDTMEHGLPPGARVRFIQHRDTVDVYEYLPAEEP